ncbi:hypothetical protein OBBRIDRAFT_796172 [Obba rivulosa]|uniref:Aminoglycoside phosphotransferase domain-containing protein n=1 Tax=Obba rivulosa TaxID=1052685 RepID=A0A8E2AT10_9APHY|nr:hypothetical protein OBBRIDRAFT_796172 [Obba rivulosa]
MANFHFALERQTFEVAALRRVKEWLPQDSVVTVPQVHSFDEDANVIIMDDCGEDAVTLKQLLLTASPQPLLAKEIGMSLGAFIGSFHSRGSGDDACLTFFDKYEMGKSMSAFITYGRLVSTLTEGKLPALSDPPLDIPQDQLDRVAIIAKDTTHAMLTTRETLVMGDFWPGNMLVKLRPGDDGEARLERIWVVDWEVAKPGLAGVEIGQICAELALVQRFSSEGREASKHILTALLRAYRDVRTVGLDVARTALVHVGAHFVAWTPRVQWGDKETVREVVREGVEYLVNAPEAEEEYVRGSLLGELLPQEVSGSVVI